MPSVGLQPRPDFAPEYAGQFLTFVVPAPGGCNLKCPFCLVRQRQEINETCLGPEDYTRFIRQSAERQRIAALSIQGYEPLLPESMPYTQAILATGRFLKLPTALVTNGVNLGKMVNQLETLSPDKIAVSLDAASADLHDRLRGVPGTWSAAVKSIERARAVLAPHTSVVVSSVLLPSKPHYLDAMPARLREIGVDRWIVTPLLRVGASQAGGPAGDRARLFHDLTVLQQAADRAQIRLTIDDEFGHLDHDAAGAFQPRLRALHVRTLPRNVDLFRLAPGGHCSRGEDVLKQVSSATPQWRPDMHAGDFLDGLSQYSPAGRDEPMAAGHGMASTQ
jgi:pyruvate-formate lyase-activating enzyme